MNQVIRTLGESVFSTPQRRYYLLIDKLDESWVDDKFRYRLIKALLETASEINKNMPGVKIIIAIRQDLLDLVIHQTREPGFQAEKYDQLAVRIKWNDDQLLGMLNKRVNLLIQRRYSSGQLKWSDIMPSKVLKVPTKEYLISRTMYRPRSSSEYCLQALTFEYFPGFSRNRVRPASRVA